MGIDRSKLEVDKGGNTHTHTPRRREGEKKETEVKKEKKNRIVVQNNVKRDDRKKEKRKKEKEKRKTEDDGKNHPHDGFPTELTTFTTEQRTRDNNRERKKEKLGNTAFPDRLVSEIAVTFVDKAGFSDQITTIQVYDGRFYLSSSKEWYEIFLLV